MAIYGIGFTSISAIHNLWTIAPPPSISDNPAHVNSNSTHVKMSKLLFFEETLKISQNFSNRDDGASVKKIWDIFPNFVAFSESINFLDLIEFQKASAATSKRHLFEFFRETFILKLLLTRGVETITSISRYAKYLSTAECSVRPKTYILRTIVILYDSLLKTQFDGNSDLLLKVSQFRNVFWVSSILPKNDWNNSTWGTI